VPPTRRSVLSRACGSFVALRGLCLSIVVLAAGARCSSSPLAPDTAPAEKPLLSLDPVDSTSLLGSGPIRAVVSSPSYYGLPQRSVLENIAGSLTLVEYPSGVPVAIVTDIQQASEPQAGDQGYSMTMFDYVEVKPSAPLAPEKWYELQLSSVPLDVRPASLGMRNKAGGAVSARFATGSHPTVQSIHICAKGDASFPVQLEFSEDVSLTADAASEVRLDPVDPSNVCVLHMPSVAGVAVHGVVFDCQLGSGRSRQLRLTVMGSLTAPTGASFEKSPGVPGEYDLLVDESMWEQYDAGCSNVVVP
jgi:hypothetical protein